MSERTYRWLFWALALLGLSCDQVGKYSAFQWLNEHGTPSRYNPNVLQHEVVPGAFRLSAEFQPSEEEVPPPDDSWLGRLRTLSADRPPAVNHGALFGLLGGYKYLANGLFALVSLAAAVAIIFWSTRRSMARDRMLCAALGLILAGTIGNLYDRLIFQGVRDFLYFYYIEWPVFNIADSCLVCGAFLLLAHAFLSGSKAQQPADATEAARETAAAKSA